MTMKQTTSQPLPNWLTTNDEKAMPFRRDTQQHLLNRAQEDPRVIDIIARIEAKTEQYIAERPESTPYNRSTLLAACPEWQWVQSICRDSSKVLNDLHADPSISMHAEDDILKLAAYRQDHSLVHFFIEYAGKVDTKIDDRDIPNNNTPMKPPLTEQERRSYAESIRMIYPIACDLQPQVALAYAPHVMHALHPYDLDAQVTADYIELARHYPSLLLTRPEQFNNFPHREAIFETAQKARANRSAAGTPLNSIEATAEQHLAALEDIAASPSPWGGSWRTRVSEALAKKQASTAQEL